MCLLVPPLRAVLVPEGQGYGRVQGLLHHLKLERVRGPFPVQVDGRLFPRLA